MAINDRVVIADKPRILELSSRACGWSTELSFQRHGCIRLKLDCFSADCCRHGAVRLGGDYPAVFQLKNEVTFSLKTTLFFPSFLRSIPSPSPPADVRPT